MRISLTGDYKFYDSRNYCGSGSISLVSEANSLTIGKFFQKLKSAVSSVWKAKVAHRPDFISGLFSTSNSPGGKFICSLTAILVNEEEQSTTPAVPVCDCGWKGGVSV